MDNTSPTKGEGEAARFRASRLEKALKEARRVLAWLDKAVGEEMARKGRGHEPLFEAVLNDAQRNFRRALSDPAPPKPSPQVARTYCAVHKPDCRGTGPACEQLSDAQEGVEGDDAGQRWTLYRYGDEWLTDGDEERDEQIEVCPVSEAERYKEQRDESDRAHLRAAGDALIANERALKLEKALEEIVSMDPYPAGAENDPYILGRDNGLAEAADVARATLQDD